MVDKNVLQKYAQINGYEFPAYNTINVIERGYNKYKGSVMVNSVIYEADEWASSIKKAEVLAAQKALRELAYSEDDSRYIQELQEIIQKKKIKKKPYYDIIESDQSLQHQPEWIGTLTVYLLDEYGNHYSRVYSLSTPSSKKKEAQQRLAKMALDDINQNKKPTMNIDLVKIWRETLND